MAGKEVRFMPVTVRSHGDIYASEGHLELTTTSGDRLEVLVNNDSHTIKVRRNTQDDKYCASPIYVREKLTGGNAAYGEFSSEYVDANLSLEILVGRIVPSLRDAIEGVRQEIVQMSKQTVQRSTMYEKAMHEYENTVYAQKTTQIKALKANLDVVERIIGMQVFGSGLYTYTACQPFEMVDYNINVFAVGCGIFIDDWGKHVKGTNCIPESEF